jgi:DNA-binding MarR family transcriptional regulator
MTRIVSGLERSGLVLRTPDPEDARRISIRATAKGTRLLQAARQRRIESLAEHLKTLSDKELALLAEAIPLLEKALSRGR